MAIQVLLADDHKVLRDGLRALLESQDDLQVVGEAEQGRAAVKLSDELNPDVVVMDLTMPDLNGIDATRQIVSRHTDTKVVVLSANLDRRRVEGVLEAGAMGVVPKESAFEELTHAIQTVMSDKVYLSPQLRSDVSLGLTVNNRISALPANGNGGARALTPREREVLQLIAEGKATKEVAYHLDLSVKTVETHRRQIMDKLNLYSVAELTKYAVKEGLTAL